MSFERRESEQWLRRQALNIVAQLPDDPEAALAILSRAETFIRGFLQEPGRAPTRPALRIIQPGESLSDRGLGVQQALVEVP